MTNVLKFFKSEFHPTFFLFFYIGPDVINVTENQHFNNGNEVTASF